MYDVLIIGAGIQGAACAQQAAKLGLSSLVVEQYDQPGQATSSKSSKLIHGGLRYLESGQFKLVRECLQEREYLIQNTPLVKRVPFFIPVYQSTQRSALIIRIGLMIYSLFSRIGFSTIKTADWHKLDGLKTQQLTTVFKYFDAQTDDRALTHYVIKNAQQLGATLSTNTEFLSAHCDNNGCTANISTNGDTQQIKCKYIINAGGPWVNQVLDKITPSPDKLDIELVLGTHIVVEGKIEQGIYYLESPTDGRAVFVMPWQNQIMIGTTEHSYNNVLEPVQIPDQDIDYLLAVYNHYFSTPINRQQVIDVFAGLRVLPRNSKTAFSRTRDTIIHQSKNNPRIYTLYGGKLTAHRATARQLFHMMKKAY